MEKNSSINNHHQNREQRGGVGGGGVFNGNSGDNNNLVRTNTHPPETRSNNNNNNNNHNNLASTTTTTSSDFVLQWGNKKRLRCMKVQSKDREGSSSATARFDRRPVVRSDLINGSKDKDCTNNNAFINLRHSPSHRVTRNSEGTVAMKGGQSNGASDKRANGAHHNTAATTTTTNHNSNNNNHNHHINNNNNNVNNGGVGSGSGSDTVHDSKKCGTSSGSDAMPAVWPPKFVIGLTNKEKEEDFYAFKGSKLPQRPKKRAKFIQRTLNLVSPGAWLCDLTLERYEVREKKISKKRPRGLKAMGNMESDSE